MPTAKPLVLLALILVGAASAIPATLTKAQAQPPEWSGWPDAACIECHLEKTPGIVEQYLSGAMGKPGVQNPDVAGELGGMDRIPCTACHGSQHTSEEDWEEAKLPDYNTCKACHQEKVDQYLAWKHSLAWRAMMAIPMVQQMPKEEVLFGCGGCHKIGVKDPQELLDLGLTRPYGVGATCDQCHTRHAFSTVEARKPEACSKCHMGFDHPQWEMWSTSKHGNIYFANKDKYPFNVSLKYVKPSDYPGPTCQLCHMPGGDHNVLTPWGFVALVAFQGRPEGLNIVDDPEWEAAKAEVLKALRVLDPQGNPTPLLEAVAQLRLVRLTPDEFMEARQRLLDVCAGCHSRDFALQYLSAADRVIKETTLQLAEAIRAVKEAREQGVYPPRPGEPDNPYPFLLNFYEEPSGVEREVWLIFLEYRMRAFQGMFHVNPDYTHWYGWSEIRRAVGDVLEDVEEAKRMKQAEASIDQLGASLEEVGVSINNLETRVAEAEAKAAAAEEKTTSLEGRVSSLESKTSSVESALSQLQDTVSSLGDKVEALKAELQGASGKVTTALGLGGIAVILAAAAIALGLKRR